MDLKTALTVVVASVPFFILTVWALVDVFVKDFGSTGRKALWALIAAVPFVGALVYLIFGFRQGRKPESA
ncbi:MAG: PLDc_N domain-containing protein [Desulfosarcina sp.]|nr:PLDc_N domain-containing protein [Desulfobacterales bacterium]